ncbi:hypothetical protein [Streptomyces sp. 351MFTsu5.1]|uniref:hypothetical protein n=1 Tax=Streptomyces sp. 351MFTsu5.1 TaxID=1172180 RepID=UPI0003631765|nr:hypothetical protein [Streptomyces sp. 351MFTsu5.1]
MTQVVVEGVVDRSGQGVDTTKPDGWGVRAEFVDGPGEAPGMKLGGIGVGTTLIDALAAVGDDRERECEEP